MIKTVCGCDCRVWYRDQLTECVICCESGHRAQSCPFSGLCLRCRQSGHRARDCRQVWGSVSLSDAASVPDPPVPVLAPVDIPVPVNVSADVPAPAIVIVDASVTGSAC